MENTSDGNTNLVAPDDTNQSVITEMKEWLKEFFSEQQQSDMIFLFDSFSFPDWLLEFILKLIGGKF